MLSSEKRLKEIFSNYTDEKTIWRLHTLDPQVPCDAVIIFGKDECGLLESSDLVWDYAERAKERYPDNTIVVEQIQRKWVVFGSSPTEEPLQKDFFNNYRITRLSTDEDFTTYLTSLEACILYILDNALLADYYKLEIYNIEDDEWREWKSLKGRTINQIRK